VEYTADLNEAATDLAASEVSERLAKDTAEKAKAVANQAQNEFEAAKAGGQEKAVKAVPTGYPPAPDIAPTCLDLQRPRYESALVTGKITE
jgi:hypothetical protein